MTEISLLSVFIAATLQKSEHDVMFICYPLHLFRQVLQYNDLLLESLTFFRSPLTWCFWYISLEDFHPVCDELNSSLQLTALSLSVVSSLVYFPPPFVLFHNSLDLKPLHSAGSQSERYQWQTKRDGYPALASQLFYMSLIPWQLPPPASSSSVLERSM